MTIEKEAASTAASRELTITRLIDAPIVLMWEVWTNPDHIKNWWGPMGFTNTIFTMDVKNGGVWDFIMHGPDGTDYKNNNVFVEVVKPEKIVYDHVSSPKHRTAIIFKAQGNKTLVTMTLTFETVESKENTIRVFKADEGLQQTIGRLGEYLSKSFNSMS